MSDEGNLDRDEVAAALRGTGLVEGLEELPQGALVIARDATIAWCNSAALSLLRYEHREELLGRPLSELAAATALDDAAWQAQWERLLAGDVWLGEIETRTADGERGMLRVGRSPLRDREGNVFAVLSLASDPSEEFRAKAALMASEERLRALFQHSSDIAMVFRRSGRIIFVSPSVERVVGWRPADLIGKNGWDFLHPDDVAADMAEVEAALAAGRPITREWRMRRPDGTYAWFEQTLTDLSHVPAIGGVVGNFRDVTERHLADAARRESEVILRRVIEETSEAFLGIDRFGYVTEWNPAAERIFGWAASEAIGSELAKLILPEHDRQSFRRMFEEVVKGGASHLLQQPFEMTAESRSGRVLPVEVSVVQVTVGQSSHFRAFMRDISDRKAIEERLAHQALTDALTGLPNRVLLRDRLARAVSRLSRREGSVAVMFLDIDRFKLVNDGLGHDAGDEMLVEIASRLHRAVRDTDTVARYGGDEFVIVAEDSGGLEEVRALAERILEIVSQPLVVAERQLRPRVSIGISLTLGGSPAPDDLVRDADIAMYRAKERGGHRAEVFEAVMESRAIVRFELERDLAQAVAASNRRRENDPAGTLRIHYQPIVSFDGPILGVEALVRWEHPRYGLMSPLEFIPLAEETGLIVPLGQFVLEESVRQVAEWRRTVSPDLSLSVNVSAHQLDGRDLAALVESVLAETGLEPDALCLELTESALLRDSGNGADTLGDLRRLGVRFAVDDFGTGYSSLVYLRRFPVQLVKLDRSFVSGVPTSPQDAAIVSAVIDLAHALGMAAVAEGIETSEQRAALASLGCELGQGYLWSRPLPGDEITALLEAGSELGSTPAALS